PDTCQFNKTEQTYIENCQLLQFIMSTGRLMVVGGTAVQTFQSGEDGQLDMADQNCEVQLRHDFTVGAGDVRISQGVAYFENVGVFNSTTDDGAAVKFGSEGETSGGKAFGRTLVGGHLYGQGGISFGLGVWPGCTFQCSSGVSVPTITGPSGNWFVGGRNQ